MTTYNKSTLATFFQTNDVPTGQDYANLIDSQVNLVETSIQSMAGPLACTELITPRVSATNVAFGGVTFNINTFTGSQLGLSTNITMGAANNISVSAVGSITVSAGNALNLDAANSVVIRSDAGSDIQVGTNLLMTAGGSVTVSAPSNITMNAGSNITLNGQVIASALRVNTDVSATNGTVYASSFRGGVGIVSAAGTAQGTAAILGFTINRGKGVVDGTTTGFAPPANRPGLIQILYNEGPSANLWPPVGGTINGLAANAVFPLAASAMFTIAHLTASAMAVK